MLSFVKLCVNQISRPRICRTMVTGLKDLARKVDYFVWIDLEMTGLNCDIHKIVEVACILTDTDMNILHEGLHLIVHQPKSVFENECDPWSKDQHLKTGLLEESLKSKITIKEADEMTAAYIKEHTKYEINEGKYFLAGNSVYMDKQFLEKYMTLTNSVLHYRIIDVSSVKILCSSWYPEKFKALPSKSYKHRALSDIRESITELKNYRKYFFVENSSERN